MHTLHADFSGGLDQNGAGEQIGYILIRFAANGSENQVFMGFKVGFQQPGYLLGTAACAEFVVRMGFGKIIILHIPEGPAGGRGQSFAQGSFACTVAAAEDDFVAHRKASFQKEKGADAAKFAVTAPFDYSPISSALMMRAQTFCFSSTSTSAATGAKLPQPEMEPGFTKQQLK